MGAYVYTNVPKGKLLDLALVPSTVIWLMVIVLEQTRRCVSGDTTQILIWWFIGYVLYTFVAALPFACLFVRLGENDKLNLAKKAAIVSCLFITLLATIANGSNWAAVIAQILH